MPGDASGVNKVEQGLGSGFCCSTDGAGGFNKEATDKILFIVNENCWKQLSDLVRSQGQPWRWRRGVFEVGIGRLIY